MPAAKIDGPRQNPDGVTISTKSGDYQYTYVFRNRGGEGYELVRRYRQVNGKGAREELSLDVTQAVRDKMDELGLTIA